MDEVRRLAMRRKHADRPHPCPCGAVPHGNGWKSHARSCPVWLRENGYPLDDGTMSGLFSVGRHASDVRAIELQLGRVRIAELPAHAWSWRGAWGAVARAGDRCLGRARVNEVERERDEWKARAELAEARLAQVDRAARCPAPNRHLPHVWYDRTRTELPFEFACSGENASSDA